MKFANEMESTLIVAIAGLSSILLLNLVSKLRYIVYWRVNCWFCNTNEWIRYTQRNSWNCPKCEQYNGFTKDGDYNRPIFAGLDRNIMKTRKVFRKSSPKNGLCKMCNINQQLKVAQLSNYVPMNEKNYDTEIESYRQQLEKVYKLCSPCRKVLQIKLHKEKESLLGFKLNETRTEKKFKKKEKGNEILKSLINNTSMIIAGFVIALVAVECYQNLLKYKDIYSTIQYFKEIFINSFERVLLIIKMKILMAFPNIENYLNEVTFMPYSDKVIAIINYLRSLNQYNEMTQKALGCFVCLLQIVGHFWNINKLKYTIAIDGLWTFFVITTIARQFVAIAPVILSFTKITSVIAVFFVYRIMKPKTSSSPLKKRISKGLVNIGNKSTSSLMDDEDSLYDTDDDVSLSQYGIHNVTESSNEPTSPLNMSKINGRTFSPRSNDSIWTNPKHNSTFCVNSVKSKSPSSVTDTIFVKPSFNRFQKLSKDDSDSDLDESISTLYIGSPKKPKKIKSLFSMRKFNATPNFVAPTPLTRSRPVISPSKLGHGTSWVAGGYWGSEGERQVFSVDGSRSSSQSSGFESQASSLNQRNMFSQPPSREESVCGEPDRNSMVDSFRSSNLSNFTSYQPQNPARIVSPVFPQMQFNNHVQIPQPRLASSMSNGFAQHYNYQSAPKAPSAGLIKLPQVNSFSSH